MDWQCDCKEEWEDCYLTTQISACLQEQVGLMSISSWTLSFSSSARTWLNFFMNSWAFPASGRFSANKQQCQIREVGCMYDIATDVIWYYKIRLFACIFFQLTGNTHKLPNHWRIIGLRLPRGGRKTCKKKNEFFNPFLYIFKRKF